MGWGHVDTHSQLLQGQDQPGGAVGRGAHQPVSRAGFKESVANGKVNSFLPSFLLFIPSLAPSLSQVPAKCHVLGTVLDIGEHRSL